MKRKIYNELLEWKQKYSTKEALLIEGARRIGKSYIVEEFARNEYRSYMLIDFSKVSKEVKEIFDNYLTDEKMLFRLLSLQLGVKLYPRESLIIFDEVQKYPRAREAVKELVANHTYDYIETGSLVSIHKNTKDILIPSEERRIDMYPMDFEEFLWALDEGDMMDFARECFERQMPLGQALHRKMMNLLRLYMIVGGMPQAVLEYIDTQDFDRVDKTKHRILDLYRQDIYNYADSQAEKVVRIWDTIPGELQRKEKRFRIGSVKKGARTRDYELALFWLNEARVVNPCYCSTEPNIGLKMNVDYSKFKLYLNDTGLLLSHAFSEGKDGMQELYRKLMLGKLEFNKGMMVENLVAQMLTATGKKLYYYSNPDKEDASVRMEIDFLIRKPAITSKHNICPIEVKSTQRYTTSSLNKFHDKFKAYLQTSYVIHSGDLKIDDGIVYLPLYMTPML